MIRNTILAAVLALITNVAFAENQFDDAYWKQLNTVPHAQTVDSAQAGPTTGRIDWVDQTPAQ